jgi:hypothetical protein
MRPWPPNHALQQTRPSRSGCNRGVPWAGALIWSGQSAQKGDHDEK